jgi:hypothetical protein
LAEATTDKRDKARNFIIGDGVERQRLRNKGKSWESQAEEGEEEESRMDGMNMKKTGWRVIDGDEDDAAWLRGVITSKDGSGRSTAADLAA